MNLRDSQFGERSSAAILGGGIAIVVSDAAEEKMFRANTAPVVAVMEDAESVRNVAEIDLPRDPVSRLVPPGVLRLTVAGLEKTGGPFPARVALTNACPESVDFGSRCYFRHSY